jgi:hypothetical protein
VQHIHLGGHQQSQEEAMPLLSRTAVHATFYALSVLAIFCANPSAAEPTTIGMLGPHLTSPITPLTQIRQCPSHERAACRRQREACIQACEEAYRECIEDCHAGD